ncbi:ABC transporter permease [Saccharibacillus sp. O23]|uniref:ABC transporter permease subunit n=1 Tax=Saccharibacillus sp. O23 TaxID=2009338 RepID=UPI000B4E04C0|nr:ABC transporter permease subunit [Saccharibacillus sp. O23]OWR28151.1 ABC transporter permease [Saccharibacillus sp. O23]
MSALTIVSLIALIPRSFDATTTETYWTIPKGSLDWQAYGENIRGFASDLLRGSLGATRYGEPVAPVVWKALLLSLPVVFGALFAGFLLGIPKGMLDYALSRTRLAALGSGITWLVQALPDFFVLLIIRRTIIHHPHWDIRFFASEGWEAFVIPTAIAAIYPVFYIARITSAAIASEEGKAYVQTARAKGLPERLVFMRHVMANAWGRILAHFMPIGVYILSSLLLIEALRNTPGAAYRMFQAIDYDKVTASTGNVEPGVIIGTALCFMLLAQIFHGIGYWARRRLIAK